MNTWYEVVLVAAIVTGILFATYLFGFLRGYRTGVYDERDRYIRWRQSGDHYDGK